MPNSYPASVPYSDFLDGGVVQAEEHDANYNALVLYVNGISTGENINTSVISGAQIVNSAVLTTPVIGTATGTALTLSGAFIAASSTLSGTLSAAAAVITGNVVYNIATNAQGASYTLVATDTGKIIEMSVGSNNTLTVPLNTSAVFAIGTQITILQTDVGQTTITPIAGVTINGTPGLKTRTRWSSATLIKRAINTWVLLGDLSA